MLNAQHLKMVQSLTLTELYIQLKLLPSLVYSYSKRCSYFAKEKQKCWSRTKKHAIYGPGLRFVSVLHENGTVLDRYESKLVLGQRPTRSQTGLSSFLGRLHVNA